MLYVRFPLSLRNVEDLQFERGYDLCHETVRLWWNRFGPMFAGEIRLWISVEVGPRSQFAQVTEVVHESGPLWGSRSVLIGTPCISRF